jgi:5-methyltetrahydrofolate--homocysteine methyltransferase
MDPIIEQIYQDVVDMNKKGVEEKVARALEMNLKAEDILNSGLIAGMQEVGRLFEIEEYYVPEMLVAAKAMQAGMIILRPRLIAEDVKPIGKVVIGTVRGDQHDIGKNLVSMMMEGAGFQMIDLGTDVSHEKFVEAVRQHQPQIVAMSSLLTTTMANMTAAVQALVSAGVRDQVRIMVGGAPVTQDFAARIQADGYAPDASQAAALARSLVSPG